jgi:hypothetical protein
MRKVTGEGRRGDANLMISVGVQSFDCAANLEF